MKYGQEVPRQLVAIERTSDSHSNHQYRKLESGPLAFQSLCNTRSCKRKLPPSFRLSGQEMLKQSEPMKHIKLLAIFALSPFLSACQSGEDDALVVLDQHGRATISSSVSDEQVMFSGTYKIEQMSHDHFVVITAQCGTLRYIYKRPQGLRILEDEVTNESAYLCGLGTQASSKVWHLALKPLTGPSMMPPSDWPD